MSAAYIQVHFRLDFIMEANTMNSDQTAPLVLIVCNIGYLLKNKQSTDLDWQENA